MAKNGQRIDSPLVNSYVVGVGVKKGASQASAKTEPEAVSKPTESYDPSGYTVDEVVAYLEANPDSTDAVLKAEKAGKARVGIMSLAD